MICPKWLIQTSVAGVVGAALVALPIWMEHGDDEPVIEHVSTHYISHSATTNAAQKAKRDARNAHRTAADAANVRRYCSNYLELHPPQSLLDARSIAEPD